MKRISSFLLVFIVLSCQSDKGSSLEKDVKDSIIIKTESKAKSKWDVAGTIYKSDDFEIIGDTTIDEEKIYFHKLKFNPYI